jgi:hypothetical protein
VPLGHKKKEKPQTKPPLGFDPKGGFIFVSPNFLYTPVRSRYQAKSSDRIFFPQFLE